MKPAERLAMIRRIRLELSGVKIKESKKMEIEPNPCWEGHEPIGLKDDGSPNCVPIKEEQSKQEFVIPSPKGDESESDFIGRCNSELYQEFPDDAQRNAVCYKSWRGE